MMISVRIRTTLKTCLMILCIGLTACTLDSKDQHFKTKEATGVISRSPMVTLKANINDSNSEDSIDYNQYLKKIWIVKDCDFSIAYNSYSFIISKIEKGIIEGRISTIAMIKPDFYSYRIAPIEWLDLSGVVNDNIAECKFSDSSGEWGNVKLIFKENEQIEAVIEHLVKNEYNKDKPAYGQYRFRPYNLDNLVNFTKNENLSFSTDLDSWGNVYFTSGEYKVETITGGELMYPGAYLTDSQNNILYIFSAPFQNASEIIDASIADINGDGLKDVKLTVSFVDYKTGLVFPESEHIEWIFYQMENGVFYDSRLSTTQN